MAAEAETRVQVATVQAMVKRVFGSDTPPPVDAYDCIIVDEAHRGYALDQDMTEGELAVRDQAQYLSSYRRVLDYFDAVRVGLTATPARHTTEIFGKPVFTYSYREAVADDWLIDHEPPIRYETLLSQKGIHFEKGEQVEAPWTSATGEIEHRGARRRPPLRCRHLQPSRHQRGLQPGHLRAAGQEIDPFGDEKALIFCATDLHADMVKRLLDEAFKAQYGDSTTRLRCDKITGPERQGQAADQPLQERALPNIAITVDLLTTGIDVPRICNLVFLRRVRSRILYEQMIGRATRRCDDIGKTVFRIYDPVDIYATLQAVNTMQPLVKDPNVTLEQLIDELNHPASLAAPGSTPGTSHAHDVLNQLNQKLMRVLRRAGHQADKRPKLQARLAELEQRWGVPPAQLHQHLHALGPAGAADYLKQSTRLLVQLAEVQELMGTAYMPILSQHVDELLAREQSWGAYARPEDYLDSFGRFVRAHINQSAALAVVVNAPKDLTREQLREVRLLLDANGFSEANLKAAWRNRSNLDIAASILGYIRQAALARVGRTPQGEPLLPFEPWTRVRRHGWTAIAKQLYGRPEALGSPRDRNDGAARSGWRLAKQLALEVVIDPSFVNRAFAQDGGAKQLDKVIGGELK